MDLKKRSAHRRQAGRQEATGGHESFAHRVRDILLTRRYLAILGNGVVGGL
jgi:hypothetical protein